MRNIRIFDEYSDYLASQEIVSGTGKYVEDIFPGFVYVRELAEQGIYAYYNGHDEEDYIFGDIIYYDGSPKLKKVYYSAFTPDMGQKVGLVVVPTNLSPDGNARIMAFTDIQDEATEPSSVIGASDPSILGANVTSPVRVFWVNDSFDENQSYFNAFPGQVVEEVGGGGLRASVPGSEGQTTHYEHPVFPMTSMTDNSYFSSDIHTEISNPYTPGERYNDLFDGSDGAISPFLSETLDTQDPMYAEEVLPGGSIGPTDPIGPIVSTKSPQSEETILGAETLGTRYLNAFSDMSGYTWTYGCPPQLSPINPGGFSSPKPVSGASGCPFPHAAAQLFYTDGTASGDWYVPAAGEMGFVSARIGMIYEIYNYLYEHGALDPLSESFFSSSTWTSTAMIGASSGEIELESSVNPAVLGASLSGVAKPLQMFFVTGWAPSEPEIDTPKAAVPATQTTLEGNVGFWVNNSSDTSRAFVRPFAMIKSGEIQRTTGDYQTSNGHQIKDIREEEK